jgi:hypothetical protein
VLIPLGPTTLLGDSGVGPDFVFVNFFCIGSLINGSSLWYPSSHAALDIVYPRVSLVLAFALFLAETTLLLGLLSATAAAVLSSISS